MPSRAELSCLVWCHGCKVLVSTKRRCKCVHRSPVGFRVAEYLDSQPNAEDPDA